MAWTLIYYADDALQAHVVANALETVGIEVQLRPGDRHGFGAALPTLGGAPTLWVRDEDSEAARSMIERASEAGRLSLVESTTGELSEAQADPTGPLDDEGDQT